MKNQALRSCEWLPLEQMKASTIFITGGTGLVGYNILKELSEVAEELELRILALVRSEEKARQLFAGLSERIIPVQGDVRAPFCIDEPVHYIIHGAGITASAAFVNQPADTIMTAVTGTQNVLDLAREKQVRSMVYLSSMEVYGSPQEDTVLTEADVGYLDPLQLRSSYPQSKRMCETLCVAYAEEFGVNVKIARLAQTFGPGMQPGDRRAIIQFMEAAMNQQDIRIKATGQSARMYLYTFDAVTALLTLLLKGKSGTAYNVANQDTYCSIQALAETIVRVVGSSSTVMVNTGTEAERRIYPPDSFLRLDTTGIESLGWKPRVSLQESLRFLASTMNRG